MVVKDLVEHVVMKMKWFRATNILADILTKDMPIKKTIYKSFETGRYFSSQNQEEAASEKQRRLLRQQQRQRRLERHR